VHQSTFIVVVERRWRHVRNVSGGAGVTAGVDVFNERSLPNHRRTIDHGFLSLSKRYRAPQFGPAGPRAARLALAGPANPSNLALCSLEVLMAISEFSPALTDQDTKSRDLKTGIYIGLLAVLLIASAVGVDRARQAAANHATEASNLWAFFQQKSIRRVFLSMFTDNLKLTLAAQPDMPAQVRQQIEATIENYVVQSKRSRSEPETGEGMEELAERAKHAEHSRDLEFNRRTYFEYGRSLYQISIVVAVTALISGSSLILYLSGIPALLGFVMLLSGFFNLAWLP
jgi:hypothetical protein